MKFDQRPWVSLDLKPQGPFEKDDSGWVYTFAYDLSNVGRSPAFNVVFSSMMIPMAPPFDAPPPSSGYSYPDPSAAVRRAIKDTCQQNEALRARGVGDILFPNSQQNLHWKAHSQVSTKGYLPALAVVACVSYQFSGDPAVHETVRVFDLERRDYGQTIHVDDFGILPQDLVFFPYLIDGFSAN
ncbi:hypothetical protein LFL96_19060 [Paraburkholderia sp. D15]|uniref:hypothetical protein n=1 Tax=Paraburkholderia sp. D15 TaxID=2880218 RepID=UPI0024792CF8|nr:hypothetical protein [Paraburkholderia sp. D15]WGS49822.1 hypothetical protein LFL96_19060 [Paraburkholderia sp. D15]